MVGSGKADDTLERETDRQTEIEIDRDRETEIEIETERAGNVLRPT